MSVERQSGAGGGMSDGSIGTVVRGDELTITRLFDAPRELVFRLWAEPRHLRRWFGPAEAEIVEVQTDFRPGGVWFAQIRSAQGRDFRMQGVYLAIAEPERIVFTHAWDDGQGGTGPQTRIVITLLEAGAGTRLTLHQSPFATTDARDTHAEGWNECLDRLQRAVGADRPGRRR